MSPDIKILDAGFSTQLTVHVSERVDGDPLWTARFLSTNPDAIVQTHLDFLRGGSDYIETCTYQASVTGFVKYMNVTEEEALALIRKSVELAAKAVKLYRKEFPDVHPQIVGSIGPYGAALHDGSEYTGNYADKISKKELKDWHRTRIEEMIKAGIEIFAFETIPCQIEAEALISLLEDYPNVKAWISFSCKDDVSLVHGEKFQDVAVHCYNLNPKQILAVGVNCLNPAYVHNLFDGINRNKDKAIPLVVYPNSGEKYVVEQEGWIGQGSKPLDTFVEDWLNLGVRYIGSCCRTYAKDVTQIKKKVIEWQKNH